VTFLNMKKPPIFFDIDGTLLDTSHELPESARKRLSAGFESVTKEPFLSSFDWPVHAGSTDLGVVEGLLISLYPDKDSSEIYLLSMNVLKAMDAYYINNSPEDIREAVFDDIVPGLTQLKELGYPLGIVTGNTDSVAKEKLSRAGLIEMFDSDLYFTGEMESTRTELLEKASLRSNGISEPTFFHTIYIADTVRDLEETARVHEYNRWLNQQILFVYLRNRSWYDQHNRKSELVSNLSWSNRGKLRIYTFDRLTDLVPIIDERENYGKYGIERF